MTAPSPSTRWIFLSACLGMLLFGISLITLGAVATDIQLKFNLDAAASGTLFSILPFGILAGSLVFGPVADHYGYRVVLLFSCAALFIGFQGIAHAPSLIILTTCVFFFGLGGGAINGATNAVVSDISSANRTGNLSLLGVCFAVGALGMPSLLGVLQGHYSVQVIVSAVGLFTGAVAVMVVLVRFPAPKQSAGVPSARVRELLGDKLLIAIAFFLFCQSAFEGIIHNWITTYLIDHLKTDVRSALYALSLNVAGMAVMRLVLGSVMRSSPPRTVLFISIGLLATGTLALYLAGDYGTAVAGLILLGAGLAAGFPVMLGFAGTLYADVSATAFSMVISVALAGNVLINYGMGVLTARFGIGLLIVFSFALTAAMFFLTLRVLSQLKSRQQP